MKFMLSYSLAMILALLGAWIFSSAMQDMYPDGILVYPPHGQNPPVPSNSTWIGMALGWFFALLVYTVMTLTAWVLVKFNMVALQALVHPLLAATLTCLLLLTGSLYLAG